MTKEIYSKSPELKRTHFLDRFEGRTSTIGKAGLLSLLQQHMPQSKIKINHEKLGNYLESGLIQPRQRNPQLSARYKYHQFDEEDKRSSNQSFKTELSRRSSLQMGSMSSTKSTSIPKLPQINKHSVGFSLKSSLELRPQRKISYDNPHKDTAQHLQFLNLFEERLKKMSKK